MIKSHGMSLNYGLDLAISLSSVQWMGDNLDQHYDSVF